MQNIQLLSFAVLILPASVANAQSERPTRAEIFDSMNASDTASPNTASPAPNPAPPAESPAPPEPPPPVPPAPPSNPHAPIILPEIKHDVTMTGRIAPGLRLDLELQYLSTNKFHDVLIGGVGWVKEPLQKMLRPGVTYNADGTYTIKFSMFNSSWLNGKFQLHYARIGILKRGAGPTYFDLRADTAGAPPIADAHGISVRLLNGAHGLTLSADVQTSNGSAPHGILSLPKTPGWTSYTIDVTQEN